MYTRPPSDRNAARDAAQVANAAKEGYTMR